MIINLGLPIMLLSIIITLAIVIYDYTQSYDPTLEYKPYICVISTECA